MRVRLCWKSLRSLKELIGLYIAMSSAYKMRWQLDESLTSEMEFMKMLNNSGPRMEPCGTPEVRGT